MNKKLIIFIVLLLLSLGITYYFLTKEKKNNMSNISSISYEDSSYTNSTDEVDINLSNVSEVYTISKGGIYHFTGTYTSYIKIDTEDDVKIILDNVTITNDSGPCIYGLNAKNIYIELVGDNKLSDGETYDFSDEEAKAVIFANDDLIFSGDGTLTINANYNDGISSDDDIVFKSGTYNITSVDDGIRGKDSVVVVNATINIDSDGDGIKSTNTEEGKGYILIQDGIINITSDNDGLSAENNIEIDSGKFNIKTGGGYTGLTTKTGFDMTYNDTSSESAKGIKAGSSILIKDIDATIDSKDDGIHSDNIIEIDDGTITITSNDDAIHADGLLQINDGTINITAREGLEATYVKINGGSINITASDDGINAGNKSNAYTTTIEINDGNITINMGSGDTDGIDSNGNLYINGGTINITGQSPFDYDGEAKYTGGTIIVNGTTTNTITNQMMGGGMNNNMDNRMNGGMQRGRR